MTGGEDRNEFRHDVGVVGGAAGGGHCGRSRARRAFVAAGGQGNDEVVSEAESMRRYLTESRHVPADAVLMEDRSTTTMENLRFSKEIMDARSGVQSVPGRRGLAYRCALVTSDYHVFRASEYAHQG